VPHQPQTDKSVSWPPLLMHRRTSKARTTPHSLHAQVDQLIAVSAGIQKSKTLQVTWRCLIVRCSHTTDRAVNTESRIDAWFLLVVTLHRVHEVLELFPSSACARKVFQARSYLSARKSWHGDRVCRGTTRLDDQRAISCCQNQFAPGHCEHWFQSASHAPLQSVLHRRCSLIWLTCRLPGQGFFGN
jgi:hypothetical protein